MILLLYLSYQSDFNVIYAFLTKDGNIFKNIGTKLNEANIKIKELCESKSKDYDLKVAKYKPEWNKIKEKKIREVNNICSNYINILFEKAYFQDSIKTIYIQDLKTSIIGSSDFFDGVGNHKKNELIEEVDKIIQSTEEKIYLRKNGLQNWDTIKLQKVQQAFIEMANKSKGELNTLNLEKVTQILVEHVSKIPKFFDFCKEKERENEVLDEIRICAKKLAQEYINRKNKELKEKKEQEQIINNLNNMIKAGEAKLKEKEKRNKNLEKLFQDTKRDLERQQIIIQNEREKNMNEINNLRNTIEEVKKKANEEINRVIASSKPNINEDERRREERRRYIEHMADLVLQGRFGNGEARRRVLGGDYNEIQNRVNERLGLPKRYPV